MLSSADADALPGAVAIEPPDLRPVARLRAGRADRVERLTGGRLLTHRALFAVVVAAGVLGAAASMLPGYHVHESGSGRLLEERAAGDAVSTLWSYTGTLLGLAGLALAGRRAARWIAAALVALLAVMAVTVFATLSLDFNLDWDTYTVERLPAQLLPVAIAALALAGPVLLGAHWALFRLQRRAPRPPRPPRPQ